MKIETPCPDCGHTPVERLELTDGVIWICLGCGYQEISASVDIETQICALAEYDPKMADSWRVSLGI